MRKNIFVSLFFFFLIHNSVNAQTIAPEFNSIEAAYKEFDFDRVDSLSYKALSLYSNYSNKELLWIHLYLGSSKFAQGFRTEAREQFVAALSLNPDLELDSAFFSPKIIQLFQEIKSEKTLLADKQESNSVRYIIQPDPRVNAAWRSLLLPGWGQLYKSENKKGKILILFSAVTATSVAVSHWKMRQAHDNYLAAKIPVQIEDNYISYKNWYRTRNSLILLGFANWTYSYFDALLKPISADSFSLQITPLQFSFVYNF